MKKTTLNFLTNELLAHTYHTIGNDYDLNRLAKIYVACEINEFGDLFVKHSDYIEFVLKNSNLFVYNDYKERKFLRAMAYASIRDLALLYNKYARFEKERKESYAKRVIEISKSLGGSVLDVGAGTAVPYSSLVMAQSLDGVTTIDKGFLLPNDCLERLNVAPRNEYFSLETEIDEFGLVAGQRPCSAINAVVEKCAKENKPYYLTLCNCNAPNGKIENWFSILKALDKNIKFNTENDEVEAFNL